MKLIAIFALGLFIGLTVGVFGTSAVWECIRMVTW